MNLMNQVNPGALVKLFCVHIFVCQGGRFSSKTRRHGAEKTLALNPLVKHVEIMENLLN